MQDLYHQPVGFKASALGVQGLVVEGLGFGDFPKNRVPYVGVLITRILLLRLLY